MNVLNKKDIPVEEIVQVYIKDLESEYAVKNTSLCGFLRVSLQKEERKKVVIEIARSSFEIVDINGNRYIDSHRFQLAIGTSQPDKRSIELTKKAPIQVEVILNQDYI